MLFFHVALAVSQEAETVVLFFKYGWNRKSSVKHKRDSFSKVLIASFWNSSSSSSFFLKNYFSSHLYPFSNSFKFSKKHISLQLCQISSLYCFIPSRWRKLEQHICFNSLVLHQHFQSPQLSMRLLLHGAGLCSRQKERVLKVLKINLLLQLAFAY